MDSKSVNNILDNMLFYTAPLAEDKIINNSICDREPSPLCHRKLLSRIKHKHKLKPIVFILILILSLITALYHKPLLSLYNSVLTYYANPNNTSLNIIYTPDSFVLTSTESELASNIYKYTNNDNFYVIKSLPLTSSVNISDTYTSKYININGLRAVVVSKNNINFLIWYNDSNIFELYGNLSEKDLIEIAELNNL